MPHVKDWENKQKDTIVWNPNSNFIYWRPYHESDLVLGKYITFKYLLKCDFFLKIWIKL